MQSQSTKTPRLTSVTWLIAGAEGGGVRSTILTTARSISKFGVTARVLALNEGSLTEACRKEGLPVRVLAVGPVPKFAGPLVGKPLEVLKMHRYRRRAVPMIRAALVETPVDAVHVVAPNLLSLATGAIDPGRQIVIWEMPNVVGDRYPFQINRRLYHRLCTRYPVLVLADSGYTASTLELPGRPKLAMVWQHPTDPGRFDPSQVEAHRRQALGIRPDDIVFGLAARFVRQKGFLTAVEAVGLLRDRVPALHLVLVGGPTDSDFAHEVRQRVSHLGLDQRVHVIGEAHDVERHYAMMDVVMNLRHDPEPLGLSVIEAMLMGKPTLVHALGGPAETVVDGVTGWHVTSVEPSAVAAGIERAVNDRHRWPDVGLQARQRALEHYTTDVLLKRYVDAASAKLAAIRTGDSPRRANPV